MFLPFFHNRDSYSFVTHTDSRFDQFYYHEVISFIRHKQAIGCISINNVFHSDTLLIAFHVSITNSLHLCTKFSDLVVT